MHHNHPKVFFILSRSLTLSFSLSSMRWRLVLLHYRLLLRMQTLFRFGGGRPLHNVQFLMFRNTTDDPYTSFLNCRSMAFPKTSVLFPILSSRGCCLLLHPPLLLTVFLCFLRCRGSSTSRLCMPFSHSWPFHRLFSSVHPLRVFGAILSLTKFPSRRATPARRVMFLPAANTCRRPQFAWVQDFLKMFLLLHGGTPSCRWQPTSSGIHNLLG
jgi:hypothetical protein